MKNNQRAKFNLGRLLQDNIVPVMFIVICIICFPMSGYSPTYLLNELVTRMGRNTFLVLSLLIPVMAGLGMNFAMTLGAMAGQIGLILVSDWQIWGIPGIILAMIISIPISILFGIFCGNLLNKAKGREMITSYIIAFFMNGVYQLIVLFMMGPIIPIIHDTLKLPRGYGIRNTVSLLNMRQHLDNLLAINVAGIKIPVLTFLIIGVLCLVIVWFRRTKLGQDMRAVAQDMEVARNAGINVDRTRIIAIVMSTVLAGYEVLLDGLQGGHSGSDIDKGRGSANQLMGRVLYSAMERMPGIRLADIRGGRFDNVICSKNCARVAVPLDRSADFEAFVRDFARVLKNEYAASDGGLSLTCRKAEVPEAMDVPATERMLHVLLALPQGVQAMSMDFPGLVQTSLNLGVMGMEADGLRMTVSVRSCIASQKAMMVQRVRSIVEYAGGTVSARNDYPGWQYVKESAFRDLVLEAYRDVSGRDGALEATHGGLECGLFIEKIPGLDALSMGPELHDVHSVRERLSVPSTERVYRLVCEILKRSK